MLSVCLQHRRNYRMDRIEWTRRSLPTFLLVVTVKLSLYGPPFLGTDRASDWRPVEQHFGYPTITLY
jgi:hypothetical protein